MVIGSNECSENIRAVYLALENITSIAKIVLTISQPQSLHARLLFASNQRNFVSLKNLVKLRSDKAYIDKIRGRFALIQPPALIW